MGPIYDATYTATFSKHEVKIYSPTGNPIIIGRHEIDGTHLWRISLLPNPEDVHQLSSSPYSHKTSLQYFSAYDLPSGEALVRYFHADAGFPVRNT